MSDGELPPRIEHGSEKEGRRRTKWGPQKRKEEEEEEEKKSLRWDGEEGVCGRWWKEASSQ